MANRRFTDQQREYLELAMSDAIIRLPDALREVVLGLLYDGKRAEDLAVEIGIDVRNVYRRYDRAVVMLGETMHQIAGE